MNLAKKVTSNINIFKKKRERKNKLEKFLDSIDDIKEADGNTLLITFNKNLAVFSKGHHFFVSEGDTVIKSNLLHLNPRVSIIKEILNNNLDEALGKILEKNEDQKNKVREILESANEILEAENSGGIE